MMSHDLRTPLTTIMGHADLLASGVFEQSASGEVEERNSVERIRQASRELLRMITDILTFAQVEAGRVEVKPVPVAVSEAIARAESLIRLRMQDLELDFHCESCDEDTVVQADPDRLQQILLNLLTNAIKFTHSGGRISVQYQPEGERVRIRVRDTGVGIPPERLQSVFEPFVQLDAPSVSDAYRGVGLGLAISRDLARAMHGDVTAESTPGAGSVFIVDLPRA
jgi:signal transduction histidine kinase